MVVVPSQEHGYPYVSDRVVVHPWPGNGYGWIITVSIGDASGDPRSRASRGARTGFMGSPLPTLSCAAGANVGVDGSWVAGNPAAAVVDIAKWNGSLLSASRAGELETGTRAVERRKRVNSSMAGERGTNVPHSSASNEELARPMSGFG
jgi:hypothetical protein